ncbi:MAG: hypothetical protein H5U03_06985, partial [Clostridia bacterium]|nr:hypothetical protein [Clostridia bacterium]
MHLMQLELVNPPLVFIPKNKRSVTDPLKLCAGEVISSLRQLIKRASPQYLLNINKYSATSTMTPGKVFYFDPLYRGSNSLASDAYLTNYYNNVFQVYDNPFSYVSGLFAASRGSIRYHFQIGDENASARLNASVSNMVVVNAPPLAANNPFSYVSGLFAASRGSIRYHFQ